MSSRLLTILPDLVIEVSSGLMVLKFFTMMLFFMVMFFFRWSHYLIHVIDVWFWAEEIWTFVFQNYQLIAIAYVKFYVTESILSLKSVPGFPAFVVPIGSSVDQQVLCWKGCIFEWVLCGICWGQSDLSEFGV